MKATIAWWDLSNSQQTIESLRGYLRNEGIRPWSKVDGLRLKFWIADRVGHRWGAVMLWESDPGGQLLPPHGAAELIGYAPSQRVRFDVEATIEGKYSRQNLSWQGTIFEDTATSRLARNGETVKLSPDTALNEPRSEFERPPADPIALFRQWFEAAVNDGVREPGVVALATAGANGRCSNRMVQTIRITDRGLVFASYTSSPKGRDIAATGWASGVLYWRETNEQIVLSGLVEQLPDSESEAIWIARPPSAHPMSVASRQSEPLDSERALRERAQRLAESGQPLPRPTHWVGYHLIPSTVEFWRGSEDRLHQRLRYDRDGDSWTSQRLEP